MTAIDATKLTLNIGDGESTETFTELGGLRDFRISLRNDSADQHNLNISNAWQQSVEQSGKQSLTISGRGTFTNSESEEILRRQAFNNTINNFQILLGNGDFISGAFSIKSYERFANMEGAIEYQVSLKSAGELLLENTKVKKIISKK